MCPARVGRGSASAGADGIGPPGRVIRSPPHHPTGAGARTAPPSARVGDVCVGGWKEIHCRSRLGSLTQFRHDKESRGLARRHQPGRNQGGEVAADGADARTSAL